MVSPALPVFPLDIETGPGLKVSRRGTKTRLDLTIGPSAAGYVPVSDADYSAAPGDTQIGLVRLTAPRTVHLPDVDEYLFAQDFVVADESGLCSEATPITIRPGPTSGDTIGGDASIALATPFQSARFRRGALNLWILA